MSTIIEEEAKTAAREERAALAGVHWIWPRKTWLQFLGALLALAMLTWGTKLWWFSRTHESTDDAQVDGHIIPVLAKVGGYVTSVRVEENRAVRAGDTLVVLDDRDYRAALAKADAELAAAVASTGSPGRVGQAAAQISSARAAAEAAHAAVIQASAGAEKAARDLDRMRGLADRNIVSRQALDVAETAVRSTAAQLAAAQGAARAADDQVVAAEAGLRGADARVAIARATRDQAALQLAYAVITAPAAGVVSKRSVEVGQLVQAGQPIMSVVPLHDVWIVANLKETQLQAVVPGDSADISVDAYAGRTFRGVVESVSPATGARFSLLPPDNATGNYTKVVQRMPIRIRLAQPQDSLALLRPGMSVRVTIDTKNAGRAPAHPAGPAASSPR
jgi:membrane fusion protein (multidrug efflux system)